MDYVAFYLNNSNQVVALECIEMSHSSFEKSLCFVRNDTEGIDAGGIWYEYKPMSIQRSNVSSDLDQKISVTIEDFDSAIFARFKNIDGNTLKKPNLHFRIYRDDDLSTPLLEYHALEIVSVSKDGSGVITFDAQAPVLNSVKTGQVYTVEEYPLLRGI